MLRVKQLIVQIKKLKKKEIFMLNKIYTFYTYTYAENLFIRSFLNKILVGIILAKKLKGQV